MKILMCLTHIFPPDNRVEKEIRTLTNAGHEIYLLCKRRQDQPSVETDGSLELIRIQTNKKFQTTYEQVFLSLTLRYPTWEKAIYNAVKSKHIDVIHVHDLPLVNTAHSVAKKYNIPLIADLHEIYPEAIKVWGRPLFNRFIDYLSRWDYQEKLCFRNTDAIITISPEAKTYFEQKYKPLKEEICVIMNTPDLDYFYSLPIDKKITKNIEPYFTICSAGNQAYIRGIHIATSALPTITDRIRDARILLVGPASKERIIEWTTNPEAKTLIEKYVICTGWQDHTLFPSYISTSGVCIIPTITNSLQIQLAAPNRLFEYMAFGKPIVASSARQQQKIIEETGAGLVFEAGNPDAFADAIIRIYEEKELASRLGKAGQKAAQEKYNWEMESKKLIQLYEKLSH